MRARIDDTAARIEDRTFRVLNERNRLFDPIRIAFNPWFIGFQLGVARRRVGSVSKLNVLRNVDQNRAGSTIGRHVESFVNSFRQVIGVFDQPVMLCAGTRDANGIGLLERIVADHEGRDLPRENDHRDRVHQCVLHARHGIGRARP